MKARLVSESYIYKEKIEYSKSSSIFESEDIKNLTPEQIQEGEKAYKLLVEKLEKGEPIEEGFLTGLIGGGIGALVGPTVMKAVCKALGVHEDGTLGKLLTSKLVLAAIGYTAAK
jgi:hypothetical protein